MVKNAADTRSIHPNQGTLRGAGKPYVALQQQGESLSIPPAALPYHLLSAQRCGLSRGQLLAVGSKPRLGPIPDTLEPNLPVDSMQCLHYAVLHEHM
jgi:hypothetical protein